MKREFLEGLGLEKEAIDQIMKEHGKSVQAAKPEDYEEIKSLKETLEQQVNDLNTTLTATNEKYADYDKNVEGLTSELNTYKTQSLKMSIASKAGLPLDLATRLSGDTEEEIKADAEKLASFVSKPAPLPLKATEPGNDDKLSPYKNMLENLNLEGE